MTAVLPQYRPDDHAARVATRPWARRAIAAARTALAASRDEFPGITERQRVDQALAATERGRR